VLGYLALSTCKRKLRSSICSLQRSSDEIGTDEIGTDHMARIIALRGVGVLFSYLYAARRPEFNAGAGMK
jgi:ABC-type microcin C transport system permease subunit YejE